jgi:N4-gp56 family major capsid protein
MANTTSTTLAALFSDIQQTALFTMQEAAFMRPLIRNFNLVGQPGKQAKVGIYPAVSSGWTTGENTDISTATTITAVEKTFAADEVAIMATLTDTARDSADDDVAASIGRVLGESLARKVDTDIAALFSGFSTTIGAATQPELTADLIFQAVANLRTNSVMGPYVGVFHPNQTYNLKKQLTNAGSTLSHNLSDLGNAVLDAGYIGRIAGVDIFESAVVTGDSTGAYVGAVMHSDALAFAMKKDLTIETQRDASLRATEIVASMTYAVGELQDLHGVQIIANAVID